MLSSSSSASPCYSETPRNTTATPSPCSGRRQGRSAKPVIVHLFTKPEDRQSHSLVVGPFVYVVLFRSSLPVATIVPSLCCTHGKSLSLRCPLLVLPVWLPRGCPRVQFAW
uniref:Uncharacterized protein n=1 Tax=Oryza sativa subsp. japonica TaxID=39947 RepID=Q5VMZ8_ORYSJ|nr:hypothetical protein [Oryza sativa Japonica Group]